MRTKVFAYKGIIGIQSSDTAEGLINDPTQSGQLGFIVDSNFVDISKEAFSLLKKIKNGNDSIGDIDVFQTADNRITFAWLGGQLRAIDPKKSEFAKNSNIDLLTPLEKGPEPPEEFINFVNSL